MPHCELRVPQLGEGLVEVRIVRLLKQAGDTVARDEPIYAMETDKAEVDIESPVDGVIEKWLVQEDDIVPVGEVVAHVKTETDAAMPQRAAHPVSAAARADTEVHARRSSLRNAAIPPRTRAYARKAGLSDEEMLHVPSAASRLMPSDIDRYLSARGVEKDQEPEYEEVPMSARQRTLFYRLSNAATQVVPGTIEEPIAWEPVERVSEWLKRKSVSEDAAPSKFLLVAWCVARSFLRHETFRSTIVDVNTLRRFAHGNLGIAVALPHDELTTAVVPRASKLSFEDFVETARSRIQTARDGVDQASRTVAHVSLTGMSAFGVRTAVPVVVPPSVATIFIGSPYDAAEQDGQGGLRLVRVVHLVLTFDHRIINGVGAAAFLSEIKERVARLPEEFGAG